MEFPGYGIYKSEACTEDRILRDASFLMGYLLSELNIPNNKIIVMGRSIGSGPATFLAEKYNPGAVILVSGFTNIKEVAKHLFGFFGSMIIKDRFHNLERIKKIKCPALFIHGKNDSVIPSSHSELLYGTSLH